MKDDAELLRLYAHDRSEDAFTELVRRHVGMVYSRALRRVGRDVHLAEDVTQHVFNALARKAHSLLGHRTLSGWLYVGTQMASAEAVRKERRRKSREREASAMETENPPSGWPNGADWARVRPLLDDLVLELKPEDREAVVLRYFEQRPFSEVGAALGSTEDGARKRVERAVERLRAMLRDRGIASTTDALELALGERPEGKGREEPLAARVAGAAFSEFAAAGAATSLLLSLFNVLSSAVVLTSAAVLAMATLLARQHLTNSDLRDQIASSVSDGQTAQALRMENRRLNQVLLDTERLRRAQSAKTQSLETPSVAVVRPPPNSLDVVVTSGNTLLWDRHPVTLEEFLQQLVAFQAQHPGSEGQLVVHGEAGAAFGATAYVVEQASKAGILDIRVDSHATPPPTGDWIMAKKAAPSPNETAPPSLPDAPLSP